MGRTLAWAARGAVAGVGPVIVVAVVTAGAGAAVGAGAPAGVPTRAFMSPPVLSGSHRRARVLPQGRSQSQGGAL